MVQSAQHRLNLRESVAKACLRLTRSYCFLSSEESSVGLRDRGVWWQEQAVGTEKHVAPESATYEGSQTVYA